MVLRILEIRGDGTFTAKYVDLQHWDLEPADWLQRPTLATTGASTSIGWQA